MMLVKILRENGLFFIGEYSSIEIKINKKNGKLKEGSAIWVG